MLRFPKRGFTLIELLVVIGVIVFLAILLFPALEAKRVPARRSACTNKLKQIGLGIQNFANARRHFPGSSTEKFTTVSDIMPNNDGGYSWQTMILPYIEEGNLYKRLDLKSQPWNAKGVEILSDPNDPANLDTKCHALVWSTPIDTYLCPSREIDSDR
ncbi:MAG: DUF1559 domain-containing protein, partial [Planctomycetia bacterium]